MWLRPQAQRQQTEFFKCIWPGLEFIEVLNETTESEVPSQQLTANQRTALCVSCQDLCQTRRNTSWSSNAWLSSKRSAGLGFSSRRCLDLGSRSRRSLHLVSCSRRSPQLVSCTQHSMRPIIQGSPQLSKSGSSYSSTGWTLWTGREVLVQSDEGFLISSLQCRWWWCHMNNAPLLKSQLALMFSSPGPPQLGHHLIYREPVLVGVRRWSHTKGVMTVEEWRSPWMAA